MRFNVGAAWPRGLEDLLRAKARLWEMLANLVFLVALGVGLYLFPRDVLPIALLAVGWAIFARSMAMRSVTMVVVTSESGEAKPAPAGSRYAATIGMLMFSSGVISRNWHVAVAGVVFSQLVSAASWQNLRARLPYLHDPWSEKLPPAPTLLHAMIGVGLLVEVVGLVSAIAYGVGGPKSLAIARALLYGLIGVILWLVMRKFLDGRGVSNEEIWHWESAEEEAAARPTRLPGGVLGLLLGLGLAAAALGYIQILRSLPATAPLLEAQKQMLDSLTRSSGLFLAVAFVPLAEEYLFRGLLYRALDREWGGWRAMLGSAAYFAIYHPPLSWLPVFALGVANAWLFRRTGRLWPCVLTHAVYNALVVGLQ